MSLIVQVGGIAKTRRIIRGRGRYEWYSADNEMYLSDNQDDAINLDLLECEYMRYERDGLDHKIFYLGVIVALCLIYNLALIIEHVTTGRFSPTLFAVLILLTLCVLFAAFAIDHYRQVGK